MLPVYLPLVNGKVLFLVSFIGIFSYTFILQFQNNKIETLQEEALKFSAEDVRFAEMYRKKEKLSKRLKYILLWTQNDFEPFNTFESRQKAFIENNCPETECYVTSDRKFFEDGLMKFDAIAFNGRTLTPTDLPRERYDYQKYIYVNTESAQYYPVCSRVFDNYFNWTLTYRLDSDILILYMLIRDKNDEVVGPKLNMKWMDTTIDEDVFNDIKAKWERKSKSAAWMATNCHSLNYREELVKILNEKFKNANLSLSTYGMCGNLSCPKEIQSSCWKLLERNYYFYLSFENSNSEDYVTEKLLNPLQHFIIPIVYGGANYSRFLPPGSYLDASKLSPEQLVAEMSHIIKSKRKYMEYFKWRSAYKYTDAYRNNICNICSALHNSTMMDEKKTYKLFRKWWHPNYREVCKSKASMLIKKMFG